MSKPIDYRELLIKQICLCYSMEGMACIPYDDADDLKDYGITPEEYQALIAAKEEAKFRHDSVHAEQMRRSYAARIR